MKNEYSLNIKSSRKIRIKKSKNNFRLFYFNYSYRKSNGSKAGIYIISCFYNKGAQAIPIRREEFNKINNKNKDYLLMDLESIGQFNLKEITTKKVILQYIK